MPLVDAKVKNAKPGVKDYKLADGGGMYLLVEPGGGKYWRLKYRFGGKEKLLCIGIYPKISLAGARDRRDAARKLLAHDVDPGEAKKAQKTARIAETENGLGHRPGMVRRA
jgi:Arm DNA-binding domain